MYPLHDKDLDRLSRDAAEHYEMDFGPSGWERLEKRLDQELPQKKDRRRFLFWLFFIVVTTGSALIGLLINSQPVTPLASRSIKSAPLNQDAAYNTPIDQTIVNSNSNTPSANGATEPSTVNNQNAANNNTTATKKSNTPYANGATKPATVNRKDAANNIKTANKKNNTPFANGATKPATVNRKDAANNTPTKPTRKPVTKNGNKRPVANDKNNQPNTAPDDLAGTTTKPAAKNNQPITNDKNDQPNNDPAATTNNNNITGTQSANKPTDPTKTPITIAKDAAPKKKNNTRNRGLELGITGGPDASMIEFGPLYKAGYNAGLQIGYRFNDRWSVNTGIIYTRKFYQADSNTFHAPKRSYISYVKLDKLEGYCAMLDIPLNVRYDFAHNDKRRFFANTGLSTYLMDEQNYDYYYWQTWGPAAYRDSSWASGKNANYLFSVLNLSIGYERMLGNKFSLQVEPYLKIPLKGMGFGSMKMDSYGMYFSLKYRPQFGSKRPSNKK